jgi:Fungal Zn(2)-Cys(6) binuclear cluster domain
MASPETPHSAPSAAPNMASGTINDGLTKLYACTTCTQRKVKCDKRQPCSACCRSRLSCKYRSTPPSQQRRKKRAAENDDGFTEALLERLRAHENALLNAGVPFQSFDEAHDSSASSRAALGVGDDAVNVSSSTAIITNASYQHDSSRSRQIRIHGKHPSRDSQSLLDTQRAADLTAPGRDHDRRVQTQPQTQVQQQQDRQEQEEQHQRLHRGVLLSEDGGKRYYEHGFIGIMGQEVSILQIVCSDKNYT